MVGKEMVVVPKTMTTETKLTDFEIKGQMIEDDSISSVGRESKG